jgi:hypothetical protein
MVILRPASCRPEVPLLLREFPYPRWGTLNAGGIRLFASYDRTSELSRGWGCEIGWKWIAAENVHPRLSSRGGCASGAKAGHEIGLFMPQLRGPAERLPDAQGHLHVVAGHSCRSWLTPPCDGDDLRLVRSRPPVQSPNCSSIARPHRQERGQRIGIKEPQRALTDWWPVPLRTA